MAERTSRAKTSKSASRTGGSRDTSRDTKRATGDDEMPDPDVLIDIPVVKVDRIHLLVQELDAHVAMKAQVLDLLDLTVGVDVHLGKLELEIEGVEAQVLAKIRLD